MICKKCSYKEHTCSACYLTEEQEYYLRGLSVCSKCWDASGLSSKYWDNKTELENYEEVATDEMKKALFGASDETKN